MNTYEVHYIAIGGVKVVEAESEDEAAAIVEQMSEVELAEGGDIDEKVQWVELVAGEDEDDAEDDDDADSLEE